FEVPAVMVALLVAVGALWGHAHRQQSSAEVAPPSLSLTMLRGAGLASAVVLSALVIIFGRTGATKERALIHAALKETHFDEPAEADSFRSALRRAVVRHPADPYFPRIGSIMAWRERKTPFRWIERALERGMTVGATHLYLARILASSGARSQALLEAR